MGVLHLIGDVHGSYRELCTLLTELGYRRPDVEDPWLWRAPSGCRLVSVGDLVDRGPDSLACLRTVKRMVEAGEAAWVLGNHDWRFRHLLRFRLGLESHRGNLAPGRLMSWVQILGLDDAERRDLLAFLDATPAFLDLGDVVVAHARWEERFRRFDREAQVMACAFGRCPEDSNAVSRFPRPGLTSFHDYCLSTFERVDLFTAVRANVARDVVAELVALGDAPPAAYIGKNLAAGLRSRAPLGEPERTVLQWAFVLEARAWTRA